MAHPMLTNAQRKFWSMRKLATTPVIGAFLAFVSMHSITGTDLDAYATLALHHSKSMDADAVITTLSGTLKRVEVERVVYGEAVCEPLPADVIAHCNAAAFAYVLAQWVQS